MQGKAIRRHHRERLKKLRRHHWGRDLSKELKMLSISIDTPTTCSCYACGNQRHNEWAKSGKETIQERRCKQKERLE